jgi:hypothetical protein
MVGNTLLSMYAKCGAIDDALGFFVHIWMLSNMGPAAMVTRLFMAL